MKTELLEGKIELLGGEKETWGWVEKSSGNMPSNHHDNFLFF
jgi:hypothetical protein